MSMSDLPIDTDHYCFIGPDPITEVGRILCSTCTVGYDVFHGIDHGEGILAMEQHEWDYHRPRRYLGACTYCGADENTYCATGCMAIDMLDYN
jgi:hypothetical protein